MATVFESNLDHALAIYLIGDSKYLNRVKHGFEKSALKIGCGVFLF